MSTSNVKIQCFSCKKVTRTFDCDGCLEKFCFDCLPKHLKELKKDLNRIENDYDQFKEKVNHQKKDSKKRLLIQEIDQWEEDSINKIKQISQEYKQTIINYTNLFINNIQNKLNQITKQIKEFNQENQFNENDLKELKDKLIILKEELDKPSNIYIQQQSSTFINQIYIILPFHKDLKWKEDGITIAGGNGKGNELNQLSNPRGIFIDDDKTIYIADSENDRIIEWKSNSTNGQIVAGGNGKGNETNQFNLPTDLIIDKENNCLIISDEVNRRVIRWSLENNTKNGDIIISNIHCSRLTMDKNGSIYVSDWKKNEIKRWKRGEKEGTIVAGGNGKGNYLNQLNSPSYIFIDEDYSLYISDTNNHRVIKWIKDAKEGIILAGGNGKGNCLTQLSFPRGVIVDQLGQIYVADWGNHRVMIWFEGIKEGKIIVGGNGEGQQSNQLNYPIDLLFDGQGNLYISDCLNNRIQKFEIDKTKSIY